MTWNNLKAVHKKSAIIDSAIKIPVKTKVSLNMTFSSPRRVNEDVPPQTLPKPVPLFWTRIKRINTDETIIWSTSKTLFISVIIAKNNI